MQVPVRSVSLRDSHKLLSEQAVSRFSDLEATSECIASPGFFHLVPLGFSANPDVLSRKGQISERENIGKKARHSAESFCQDCVSRTSDAGITGVPGAVRIFLVCVEVEKT